MPGTHTNSRSIQPLARRPGNPRRRMVFIDFDNTVTAYDVLDGIIEKFSITGDWRRYETAWRNGEIGSRECIHHQMRCIRARRDELLAFAAGAGIDPGFRSFLSCLRHLGLRPVILSDGFSCIIDRILRKHRIEGIPVYANELKFRGDRLVPLFPYGNSVCSHCANCKTGIMACLSYPDRSITYIGDGISDICPARFADVVFAKNALLEHFRQAGRACIPFAGFRDIQARLRHERAEIPLRRNAMCS